MFKPRKLLVASTQNQTRQRTTANFVPRSSSALVSMLLSTAILSMPVSSTAQTEADILVSVSSGVGKYLAEQGVNLAPVRVYTGGGEQLVVETSLHGTTIYTDGNVGMLNSSFKPGKAVSGPIGSVTGTGLNLTAVVGGNPLSTGSISTVNNASGSISAHSSASAISISTGGG